MRTTPRRRITLQCSQRRLIEAITFIFGPPRGLPLDNYRVRLRAPLTSVATFAPPYSRVRISGPSGVTATVCS